MLEKLLRLIAEGGIATPEGLAERLSADRPLVEAMLEDLVRLGYLRKVSTRCAGHGAYCQACPVGSCSVTGAGQVWSLTERGATAVPQQVPGPA